MYASKQLNFNHPISREEIIEAVMYLADNDDLIYQNVKGGTVIGRTSDFMSQDIAVVSENGCYLDLDEFHTQILVVSHPFPGAKFAVLEYQDNYDKAVDQFASQLAAILDISNEER